MEAKKVKLDQDAFVCSICLDLMKEPVTIPCGHSYCMDCIELHWDGEDWKENHTCPQCRKIFEPRPDLEKNIILAALVEELRVAGEVFPAANCYAGPGNVACDVCTGRKLKAVKYCLVCLAAFCETHLQPHHDAPPLQIHKLIDPSKNLHEHICPHHDEVIKSFCRTDQQNICYLCLIYEHKCHETVPIAKERAEKQKELEVSRQQIQQRIQDREKYVKLLHQEVKAINLSANEAVEECEKIFTELVRVIQNRSLDVKQQITTQQQTKLSQAKEVQKKLEQEIIELKKTDAKLEQLSLTEDHIQFLYVYPSVSALRESTHSSSFNSRPLKYFEAVTAAVSELREKLQDILTEKWTNISVIEVDALLPPVEPIYRAGFLKCSQEITLDPNTANTYLLLSEGNRRATVTEEQQSYCSNRDRFTAYREVLSSESLSGRCYFEVEWIGRTVSVGLAYKDTSRVGMSDKCAFGFNDKSWALCCTPNCYTFWHNFTETSLSGPPSHRIGVYLDHRAGILSFYSVSETMTLLHRVQTSFTQPLYAGLRFHYCVGDTAEFIKLK
ncbi:tripartite motif-containing protein 16-like [Leuresthes tenuis]|uniref:tripartite motif-containing protein 16-like n=1 Tax=Leuresthes tenuis TaxID=355514 RepID=UPI003B503EEA